MYLLSNNLFGSWFFLFSCLGKIFGKTVLQKKAKQGKTFGVCQLLKADSKCEIEKQEYFKLFLQLHRSKTEHPLECTSTLGSCL